MEVQLLNGTRSSINLAPSTANTAVSSAVAAETTLATINVGANQMVNRAVRLVITSTSTNTLVTVRTWRVRLGGTIVAQWTPNVSGAIYSVEFSIFDRGNNNQRSTWHGTLNSITSANAYTSAIATTAATTITITAEQASVSGSEITTLEAYYVELIR